jgi:3-dehydroquinate dehydratase-2
MARSVKRIEIPGARIHPAGFGRVEGIVSIRAGDRKHGWPARERAPRGKSGGAIGTGLCLESKAWRMRNGRSRAPQTVLLLAPSLEGPSMRKILLLQGANMAFVGRRQPELYGKTTAKELDAALLAFAAAQGCELSIFYTHVEGEAIRRIYEAVDEPRDGLLMNPAGFTYAGYALRDCLRAVPIPYVEVHMTNLDKRGMHSVTAETAVGVVTGFGVRSYMLGLEGLLGHLSALEAKA